MKQSNDATASSKGTIYQLYIALEKCFQLKTGQKVIVERYGDVTLTGSEQIESKNYSDSLTDNHINFWKTLGNWMKKGFDETSYQSLVLCTTQPFGIDSSFKTWNAMTVEQRLNTLQRIHQSSHLREQKRLTNPNKSGEQAPQSYRIQQRVMAVAEQEKLKRVVERLVIAAASPDLTGVYHGLVEHYGRFVLKEKAFDFVDALLGFVISPKIVDENSWEISKEHFDDKVRELTPLYMQGTRVFPTKFKRDKPPTAAEIQALGKLFIGKIEGIQYHQVIPVAAMDYLYASDTVIKDLRDYNVPPQHFPNFKDDVRGQFEPLYRTRCRSVKDVIKDSQDFYDTITANNPPTFPGFEIPNLSFRNGVIHMLCDDPDTNLKWRLENP